eukprot:CAMPEP_0179254896 /NCGR_PEP_ID=MMETSP0797-20121207/23470_1 /TAXON_ID=47934 /ORGANISM="Dinophysis acuminata, Strain DAEP01" /LENGTH=52 /DNA_ID=CAMNT_0020962779 /DNA_START=369 /DNA_END=527 /DNA_ORIENTATION=+
MPSYSSAGGFKVALGGFFPRMANGDRLPVEVRLDWIGNWVGPTHTPPLRGLI